MSSRVIRCLVLAALAVPVALLLSPVQAQIRPPGIPRPPGGIGGMPGGGIGGMPGPGGGGIGGMPGGRGPIGPPTIEWRCSKCNALLGTGPVKPRLANCPQCGTRFISGGIGGPPMGGPPVGGQPPGVPNVPLTPPPVNEPAPPANELPPAPLDPIGPAAPANNDNAAVPAAAAGNAAAADSGMSGRAVLIALIVVGSVLLLFAAFGTFLYISINRAAKDDVPQRRRKRVYHDLD